MAITIAIADPHPVLRAGIRSFFGSHACIHVAGECADLGELNNVLQSTPTDMVVLDAAIATRNIEGGVVWGLSALRTEVPFASGGTTVANFDGFDPLHLWETPEIETHFVDGGGAPGGVGEIGPVPTLAAACNAIRAATGVRLTELPITRRGYSIA